MEIVCQLTGSSTMHKQSIDTQENKKSANFTLLATSLPLTNPIQMPAACPVFEGLVVNKATDLTHFEMTLTFYFHLHL